MDQVFALPVGALLIFVLRVIDVSMATTRLIFVVRGKPMLAASIGFFEVLIWMVTIGHALQHLNSVPHLLGYAGGFAVGSYVGVWLEGRLAIGLNAVQAVCRLDKERGDGRGRDHIASELRNAGFAVTEMTGRGRDGRVDLFSIVVPRRRVDSVTQILRAHDPRAFVTIEEVRATRGGYMALAGRKTPLLAPPWLHHLGHAEPSAIEKHPRRPSMTGLRVATPTASPTSEEREFAAELITAQDGLVLEIGTGRCASMTQVLVRRGFRVFTVDRDRAAAFEASRVLATAGVLNRTSVVVADAANLPFRRGSIHTVVAYSSLHHTTNLPGAVRGIAAVLGEQGRLIVSDWDQGANGALDRLLKALEAWFEEVTVIPRGIRRVYVCEDPRSGPRVPGMS
jgi:uncharacterized protein YebE (UPF0316 family)